MSKISEYHTHFQKNYRLVSIFPVFSKVFERLVSRNILEFFDNILSNFQFGFRKGYRIQHCLLLMLEIWKGASQSNKAFGALLTDISKAFDCLSHDLLIAMLHAYGLDKNSLNILQDYLSNRKQRIKVEGILSRESQASILGPRLFNVFMGDMFMILKVTYLLVMQMIAHHLWLEITTDVIKTLEEIRENLLNWFSNNEMKLNTDKCHLILNNQESNTLKIGDLRINNSLSEKLPGITFDCKLKFIKHIKDIWQKA